MSERLDKLMAFHEQDPTDTFCTYGIAMEYQKTGDLEAALRWLDRTIEIDSDYAYAHYQRARVLADRGDIDAAQSAIDAGLTAAQHTSDTHAAEELAVLRKSLA